MGMLRLVENAFSHVLPTVRYSKSQSQVLASVPAGSRGNPASGMAPNFQSRDSNIMCDAGVDYSQLGRQLPPWTSVRTPSSGARDSAPVDLKAMSVKSHDRRSN